MATPDAVVRSGVIHRADPILIENFDRDLTIDGPVAVFDSLAHACMLQAARGDTKLWRRWKEISVLLEGLGNDGGPAADIQCSIESDS